jgi:hypothetical protein
VRQVGASPALLAPLRNDLVVDTVGRYVNQPESQPSNMRASIGDGRTTQVTYRNGLLYSGACAARSHAALNGMVAA